MRRRALPAVIAVSALAIGTLLAASPAAAVEPGTGAVLFNPDGSPIGSETVYPSGYAQYVYTSETEDDDAWGLDADGNPANEEGSGFTAGIPLGFEVLIDGILYDSAVVGSNGALCLVPVTGVNDAVDDVCDDYSEGAASILSEDYLSGEPGAVAAVLALFNDQYPPNAEEPIYEDDNPEPIGCTFGAYLYFDGVDYFCSSIAWGYTTYEGMSAFVATWFHNPDYDASEDQQELFNTYQVLIVDGPGTDAYVVLNYDEVREFGDTESDLYSYGPYEDACDTGDDTAYLSVGLGSSNADHTSNPTLDLFGPACASPYIVATAEELRDGGTRALAAGSLNSTVPGRYVLGWIGGLPTADPFAQILPVTGPAQAPGLLALGVLALLTGAAVLVGRARRRTA